MVFLCAMAINQVRPIDELMSQLLLEQTLRDAADAVLVNNSETDARPIIFWFRVKDELERNRSQPSWNSGVGEDYVCLCCRTNR